MARYGHISEAEAQRLKNRTGMNQADKRARRRTQPRAPITPSPAPPGGFVLIYPHDVLRNTGQLTWQQRSRQKHRGLRVFGERLPDEHYRGYAWVTITRVMGPRQRRLDGDNLQLGTKGLRDALKAGGYIQDDAPQYVTITYHEDSSRRAQGPYIEMLVAYHGEA